MNGKILTYIKAEIILDVLELKWCKMLDLVELEYDKMFQKKWPDLNSYFSALHWTHSDKEKTHRSVCSDLYSLVYCHVHQRLLINWTQLHKFGLDVLLQPCSAHSLPPVSITFSRDTVAVTAADVWKQYWSTAGEAAAHTATLLLSINDAFHGRWYKLSRCEQRPRASKTVTGICTVHIAYVLFSRGTGASQNKLKLMYFSGVPWTPVVMRRLGAKGFSSRTLQSFN